MKQIRFLSFALFLMAATPLFIACSDDDDSKTDVDTNKAFTECPDANHPHMIDLGLPSGTKWACCNVGAKAPEEYGNYYAWGETQPKSEYNWDTYQYYDGSKSGDDRFVNIGSDIAGTVYDAATANWGTPWRMPSRVQFLELKDECSSEWTNQSGVNGYKFTGRNGGTIFLPAAGCRTENGFLSEDSFGGGYWSSTSTAPKASYGLHYDSNGPFWSSVFTRNYGFTVRPVR